MVIPTSAVATTDDVDEWWCVSTPDGDAEDLPVNPVLVLAEFVEELIGVVKVHFHGCCAGIIHGLAPL